MRGQLGELQRVLRDSWMQNGLPLNQKLQNAQRTQQPQKQKCSCCCHFVLIWDKLDKAGQLDEGAGDVLFDHAVHSVISHNGTIYKPLVVYLKIIRKYLERKHYRDSLPRTQWKTLMEFSHIHLFPPPTLTNYSYCTHVFGSQRACRDSFLFINYASKVNVTQSLPLLQELLGSWRRSLKKLVPILHY
ncbi:hypothetical protein BCR33DRAFT_391542 [Rhizoclosmatium globosum]|uniref:Uncharacterized protein n=1 Tax=Rhizoclosmatium globosum TaxID=329046 RepID=A0A1Y2BXR8_9FUNG|nr:hypothetical protein BCR33DRAFT_391542 [Rhizoclosmatium globosum]|eukprot:ORY39570.1 hypothetical protein BCR33DRAFT_391542 [Rhizoclosmatium globosum]